MRNVEKRLKSNFLLALPSLMWSLLLLIAFGISLPAVILSENAQRIPLAGAVFLWLFLLIMLACGIVFLVEFLRNWQWVTIGDDYIRVDCSLFTVKTIPIAQIQRCWVRKGVEFEIARRTSIKRDCIVIDTAKKRKRTAVVLGYSDKSLPYIILPDTPANRYALRVLPEQVREELIYK